MQDDRTRYVCGCTTLTGNLLTEEVGTFELVWTRQFANPLHCLLYEDITKDGLKEIVALSTAGVHVLQVGTTLA